MSFILVNSHVVCFFPSFYFQISYILVFQMIPVFCKPDTNRLFLTSLTILVL